MESKQPTKPQPQPKEEEGILSGIPEIVMVEDHSLGLGIKIGSSNLRADNLCSLALGLMKSWIAENPNPTKPSKKNGGYIQ